MGLGRGCEKILTEHSPDPGKSLCVWVRNQTGPFVASNLVFGALISGAYALRDGHFGTCTGERPSGGGILESTLGSPRD